MIQQILCLLLAVGSVAPRPAAQRPSPAAELNWKQINIEALQKLTEYIRLDTSNPPGNESRGVSWFARIFEAEGIPYDTGESAPGRGNIVARLKSTLPEGKKEPGLILLSHMDVVPVSREFWTADPFGAETRDGYIWGRGSVDMKSEGIAELMAFLSLRRTGVPLRRDVIFLATADEEAGGNFGAGWVVENRPQWIAGAGFLITEGGRTVAGSSGEPIYYGVRPTEKTPAWLKLTATGTSGHASVPRPDSAVNRLIAALERLRKYETPIEVAPTIARMFASMAPYEQEPWMSRMRDIAVYAKTPGARAELAKNPGLLALLTNTISITGLEGAKKINVIPPVATALVDCRLLPGWTADRWVREIKNVLADDSIQVDVVLNFPATISPVDTPLYEAIAAAVKRLHPTAGVAQSISAGFTDSHFFRDRGITSYGVGPFALSEADSGRAHGNDERLPVKAFFDGVRWMWGVVEVFTRADQR